MYIYILKKNIYISINIRTCRCDVNGCDGHHTHVGFSHFFVVISLARAFCTQQAPSVTLQPARLDISISKQLRLSKEDFFVFLGLHLHICTLHPPLHTSKNAQIKATFSRGESIFHHSSIFWQRKSALICPRSAHLAWVGASWHNTCQRRSWPRRNPIDP